VVCFVTIVALFYAEENWRGSRALGRYRAEIAARGETLNFMELVPPEIPDVQNFADTPFIRAVFRRPFDGDVTNRWPPDLSLAESRLEKRQSSGRRETTDLVAWREALATARKSHSIARRERTSAEQAEAAQGVLSRLQVFEPVLNEFRANLSRPKARYPVLYLEDDPYAILLPHLARLKSIAIELSLHASAELATGDSQHALDDVLLELRLAESLEDETFSISQLVRIAIFEITIQPIWEGIAAHRWTDAQLTTLQDRLEAIDFVRALPRCLCVERAAGLSMVNFMRHRKLGDYLDVFNTPDHQSEMVQSLVTAGGWIAPRGWYCMEGVNYGRLMDTEIAVARTRPFDISAARAAGAEVGKTLERSQRSAMGAVFHHTVLAALIMPSLEKLGTKFAVGQTLAGQATAACGLERYRLSKQNVPETLEQLVPKYLNAVPRDFFAGAPMKFRRTSADTFLLYSVGADGKDNGGSPGRTPLDETSGDWVW